MEEEFEKLEFLFISDHKKAIEESRKIILSVSNFEKWEEFEDFHTKHKIVTNCDENLFSTQISVLCFDCSKNHAFTVCLSCFLKGNHESHYYIILPRFYGHCACGDSSCWKPSGFCSEHNHQPPEHPEDYLDEKLRHKLSDVIFRAALSAVAKLTSKKDQQVVEIIQFVGSFIKFGDGFYRLISIAFTDKIDFKKLLRNVSSYSQIYNQMINALCLYCFHDQYFKQKLVLATYDNMIDVYMKDSLEIVIKKKENENYNVWENFWSQVITSSDFKRNIEEHNWDWVTFFVTLSSCYKELLGFIGNSAFNSSALPCFYKSLITDAALITKIQPIEQTQQLFDRLFTEVFNCGTSTAPKKTNNTNIVASFKPNRAEYYYLPVFVYQSFYFKFFLCFKTKHDLKLDVLIEHLDKMINISSIFKIGKNAIGSGNGEENQNDKFVQRFLEKDSRFSPNLFYYKSFHNGASFFINMPLYDSLVSLFRLDNVTRVKVARLLCQKKFQSLRVKLGIVTLKKILSFVCYHQGITPKTNFGLNLVYSQFDMSLRTTHTISRYFALFQLLIGLESENKNESAKGSECECENCVECGNDVEFSLKEFFAFELARELGIFDDFNGVEYKDEDVNELQDKMFFSFFYVSLLLVIERTLFNLNGFSYIQEQVVFALKDGVTDFYSVNQSYDIEAINVPEIFPLADKIISNVSTTNKDDETVDHEIFYYLKDGVEWKPLSAINSINQQKTLLSREIAKNLSELLSLPDFESEDTFFFRPRKTVYEEEKLYDNDASEYDNSVDISGLNIRLKEFLLTPTVLAVIYYSLRTNTSSQINDHLAMNILVLVSKFVAEKQKEEEIKDINASFDEIHFTSLVDLIEKLRKTVFGYRVDQCGSGFVSCSLTKKSFVNLLKTKISSDSMPAKSLVDVLKDKGELGRSCVTKMSLDSSISFDDSGVSEDDKARKKELAKMRKESILAQFNKVQSDFALGKEGASSSIDQTSSVDANSDSCSVCGSTSVSDLCYPVYFYRTKVPFIVDKPPEFEGDEEGMTAVDDDDDDSRFQEHQNGIVEGGDEDDNYDYSVPVDQRLKEELMGRMEELHLTDNSPEAVRQRQVLVDSLRQQIEAKHGRHEVRARQRERMHEREKSEGDVKHSKGKRRMTVGASYVVQFGICPHPIHPQCAKGDTFSCPLCKSFKNGFLPFIASIPKSQLFKGDKLSEKVVHSISIFIEKFASFFPNVNLTKSGLFIELIKSLSGLIVTYEVRVRSIARCLDSSKTFDLARNLFLAVWHGYRIQGKPPITVDESKLTEIQRFVKRLIENDSALDQEFNESLHESFISPSINSIRLTSSNFGDVTTKRFSQEAYLFLRRVALIEHFFLGKKSTAAAAAAALDGDRVNWQEALSEASLVKRYNVDFGKEELHLTEFVFDELPSAFFGFCAPPFEFPVHKVGKASVYCFLDYNALIRSFQNFAGDGERECNCDVKRIERNFETAEKEKLPSLICFDYATRICPSVLIYVGGDASKVIVADQSRYASLKPFYFNLYMQPDVGYTRLQPLNLNEKSYRRFMDEVLSGDFSYSLQDIF